MKKLTKLLSGLACLALATSLIACKTPEDPTGGAPGGNGTTPEETPTTPTGNTVTVSGDLITFKANANAVANGADVKLCLKYNRSAEGADEAITISDCNIEVKYNGQTVSVGKTLNFELDPYSSFDANYDYSAAEIPAKQKEYKAFIDVAKDVKAGDVVTVELKSGVVSGNGLGKVELADVVIALIDKNKDAGGKENSYYFELCPKENEYQGLITKVNGKEFESGEDDPIEGSTDGDEGIVLVTLTDWSKGFDLEVYNYSDNSEVGDTFAVGAKAVIKYKKDSDEGSFKFCNYDWKALTSSEGLEGAVLSSDGALQLNANEGTITYVLTEEDSKACLYKKFVLQGAGVTIVSFDLVAPDAE